MGRMAQNLVTQVPMAKNPATQVSAEKGLLTRLEIPQSGADWQQNTMRTI